eukprot:10441433-Alexandrium_andersonii.AAC.1
MPLVVPGVTCRLLEPICASPGMSCFAGLLRRSFTGDAPPRSQSGVGRSSSNSGSSSNST